MWRVVTDSFPRQLARTQRFTLGEPRTISVSADGRLVIFLRSAAGDDPVNSLCVLDTSSSEEHLVADARELLGETPSDLPPEERARRERTREAAGGITAYATDGTGRVAAFALGGRLFVAGLVTGGVRPLAVEGTVFDPRPDPPAQRVAYVSGRQLRIAELSGSNRPLAGGGGEPDTVSWGSADFIAAEEMHRFRGYWWSPDGAVIAACRVDTADVSSWSIADPAQPDRPPSAVRYPAAGTANPDVSLHLLRLDGSRQQVDWDVAGLPYLAAVDWSPEGLVIQVQSRDQRECAFLLVDPTSGATDVLATDRDEQWVELVPGTPRLLPGAILVHAADRDGVRRLLVDNEPVTPDGLQVRSVAAVGAEGITFLANDDHDATSQHVWHRSPDGTLTALTDEPGVHSASAGGPTIVVRSATLDIAGTRTATLEGVELASNAARPELRPEPMFSRSGSEEIATAVLLPRDHDGSALPVLLDPYGGPHALRVTRTRASFLTSQWFADQGFAVVVADGRGTPGRGTVWERAVFHDLAATLDDQIVALEAAAERHPELDLGRVGIRGWSFGGYLAALAVLRRPEIFHAAVAGAPVTEWRLYDTHYTERYLGKPRIQPEVYDANSLLPLAADLRRPLLLIHGLADDNVVAAHTLRLSSALLEAGRPHEVLPLSGVTHMTPQEVVAENLLLHQLAFLRRTLAVSETPPG